MSCSQMQVNERRKNMKKIITVLLVAISITMTTSCTGKGKESQMTNSSLSIFQAQADESLFQKVCSADEALAEAKNSNTVVFETHGCSSGKKDWKNFYDAVTAGKPASVLCANYYVLDRAHVSNELYEQEKDNYPVLYFELIEYNGKEFTLTTRDSKSSEIESKQTFKYLLHFTGQAPEQALVKEYDRYILADDPSLTYEQIEKSMISSQLEDWIDFAEVYHDYDNFYGDDV